MTQKPYDPDAWKVRWGLVPKPMARTPWGSEIERKPRITAEGLSAVAALASAVAAIGAVVTGYMQYNATYDAVNAADKNRTFQALVEAYDASCNYVRSIDFAIIADPGEKTWWVSKASAPANYRDTKLYDNHLIDDFEAKIRAFSIWNTDSAFYIAVMQLVRDMRYSNKFETSDEWLLELAKGKLTCNSMANYMAYWYRSGDLGSPPNMKIVLVDEEEYIRVMERKFPPSVPPYKPE